jgi:hypothetical protein
MVTAPSAPSIRNAAERAIHQEQESASVGRPKNSINEFLAKALGAIFVRYNNYVGRSSVIGHDRQASQIEIGRFTCFLKLVTAPLSSFLRTAGKAKVSTTKVARESATLYGSPIKRKSGRSS